LKKANSGGVGVGGERLEEQRGKRSHGRQVTPEVLFESIGDFDRRRSVLVGERPKERGFERRKERWTCFDCHQWGRTTSQGPGNKSKGERRRGKIDGTEGGGWYGWTKMEKFCPQRGLCRYGREGEIGGVAPSSLANDGFLLGEKGVWVQTVGKTFLPRQGVFSGLSRRLKNRFGKPLTGTVGVFTE